MYHGIGVKAVIDILKDIIHGQRRQLIVQLPAGYEENGRQRYPTVYVLDGDRQIKHAVSTVLSLVERRKMPPSIVVALPNVSDEARARDYLPPDSSQSGDEVGGADAFLVDLEDRLIPFIEARYRTEPFRMIAGHSRGGLFVFYTLFERPDLFQARFAFSPALWHDNDTIVVRAQQTLSNVAGRGGFLFMNLGGKENENITQAFHRMHFTLRRFAPSWLRWHVAPIATDESHGTTPLLGQYQALRMLFTNFTPDADDFQSRGLDAVSDHYERLSAELGYTLLPEEGLLNSAGYLHLQRTHNRFQLIHLLLHGVVGGLGLLNVDLADELVVAHRLGPLQQERDVAEQQGHIAVAGSVVRVEELLVQLV